MHNSGCFILAEPGSFGAYAEQSEASPMSCSSPLSNSSGAGLALHGKLTCPVGPPQSYDQDQNEADVLSENESFSLPSSEYVKRLYSGESLSATVRSSLVDWMVNTAHGLCLSNDATFLAVQLLDKYMQGALRQEGQGPVFAKLNQLQLIGVTALWVAAKFEGGVIPPASAFLQQLSSSSPMPCMRHELLAAEQMLLMTLDYRLTYATSKSFLRRYMSSLHESQKLDRRTYFTASYLSELSLLDAGMLCFKPSEVAASSYAWALELNNQACNDEDFHQHTGYSLAQLAPCLERLALVHTAACNTSRPCMISLKYLARELEQVAALPPVNQGGPKECEQAVSCLLSARVASTDLNNCLDINA